MVWPGHLCLMKLLRAVLYWDECRIETVVEDNDGHRRMIVTKCMAKERRAIPPKKWADGVKGEVEFQRAVESKPPGTYIPR